MSWWTASEISSERVRQLYPPDALGRGLLRRRRDARTPAPQLPRPVRPDPCARGARDLARGDPGPDPRGVRAVPRGGPDERAVDDVAGEVAPLLARGLRDLPARHRDRRRPSCG